jgi:hypothetical protein
VVNLSVVTGAGSADPLPEHDDLAQDLRRLREKGLLRIRDLDLPALDAIAGHVADPSARSGPRAIEHLLRHAAERLGDDEFGDAARCLFGLVQGTIGHKPTDLRERAAAMFALSAETFRKDKERVIIARLADELLTLAVEEPAEDGASAPTTAAAVTGLPGETPFFTGREPETDFLINAFTADREVGRRPVICALHGMAGVGKTALAVRTAHRLADAFPDGALFLDLGGHAVRFLGQDAGDTLDRLLRRLGLPPERIPRHVGDRSALLSTHLAGRRMLLVATRRPRRHAASIRRTRAHGSLRAGARWLPARYAASAPPSPTLSARGQHFTPPLSHDELAFYDAVYLARRLGSDGQLRFVANGEQIQLRCTALRSRKRRPGNRSLPADVGRARAPAAPERSLEVHRSSDGPARTLAWRCLGVPGGAPAVPRRGFAPMVLPPESGGPCGRLAGTGETRIRDCAEFLQRSSLGPIHVRPGEGQEPGVRQGHATPLPGG